MNAMIINNYNTLVSELTKELSGQANSFCRTGYLLKVARDTDLIREAGYSDVYAFAKNVFGLDKSMTSRYININDRFSEEGYSENLLPEYQNFGYSKLSIMLTLPEEINTELSPELSKSDIQTVKEEYEAEQKITPIELMTEPAPDQPETDKDEFLALVVKQLNDEHPTPIALIHQIRQDGPVSVDDVMDAYRPDGDRIFIIRISGMGRFNISMKSKEISIVNARSFEKSVASWDEWMDIVLEDEERREYKEEAPEISKKKVEKSAESRQERIKEAQKKNVQEIDAYHEKQTEIERVEGEVIETPVEAAGEVEAAGTDEEVESEPMAAGEEDMMIETLKTLISPTECIKIRERVRGMDSLRGYREDLDIVCEWIAEFHTVTNKLYAKLASRGM